MIKKLFIAISIAIFTSNLAIANDKQETINHCQYLKDQKESYQQARRNGGSGSQMDYWRKRMHEIDDEMSRWKCRKVWKYLR